ncbi:MAG: hypothetical protein KIT74_07810 [Fimbriimonadales bacterium]|nr:hypothetical protein [Fimbriimonadales bacterium]
MLPAVLLLGYDALLPVRIAHAELRECAVRVQVTATASGQLTQFSYEVYRDSVGRFRVDFHPATGNKTTIYADGQTIIVHDNARNVYTENAYTPERTRVENIGAAFGASDPLLQVFLDPGVGLARFCAMWGASDFLKSETEENTLFASQANTPVKVRLSSKTWLIESVMIGETGQAAKWEVSSAGLPKEDAIPWTPPKDSIRVESMAPNALPAPVVTDEAKPVVERSRDAYRRLESVEYSTNAYLFTSAGDDTRNANVWWERDGNFRLQATSTSANRSLEVLYFGDILSAFNRVSRVAVRGNAKRQVVFDYVDALGGPSEPFAVALMTGRAYWDRFLIPGSKTQLVAVKPDGTAELSVETFDGWTVSLHIAPDGLINRIDRTLKVEGKVTTSETVIYSFSAVNEPIALSKWSLAVPSGTEFAPLPNL